MDDQNCWLFRRRQGSLRLKRSWTSRMDIIDELHPPNPARASIRLRLRLHIRRRIRIEKACVLPTPPTLDPTY